MKNIKNIVILFLIINSILLIYLLFFLEPVKTYTLEELMEQNYNGVYEGEIIIEEDTEIYFDNIKYLIEQYTGDIGVYNLTRQIGNLVYKDFKQLYIETSGMNNNEITNYFNKNKKDIALKTGITTSDIFAKLINKLQIYKDGTLEYENSKIIENTVQVGDKYTTFDFQIDYSNGKSLEFKIYFSNKDNIDTPIIIIEP